MNESDKALLEELNKHKLILAQYAEDLFTYTNSPKERSDAILFAVRVLSALSNPAYTPAHDAAMFLQMINMDDESDAIHS